ncbi:MAG TPA: hypothetical protein VK828_10295 [Terriglobales bacterium]|jgi:hypothetical protein|nr:hypothetical protein [Terriglobales bacterium]
MHRCGLGLLFTSAIISMLALAGCLGKNSTTPGEGGVASVTLSPTNTLSLDVGTTLVFSATGKDSSGRTVLPVSIQFVVSVPTGSSNPSPLAVASNGNTCAGTWDASVAFCSPGNPGIALVTAVINGVSSAPTTVYVHLHVDSVQISNSAEGIAPPYNCFSQGQTWRFEAFAYSNGADITTSVGPISWSSSNASVVTTAPYVPQNQATVLNQVLTTAKTPGVTQLFASASGTTSSPYLYTTCLIQAIYLQINGQAGQGNSISVNNGTSVGVNAIAVDSLCGVANNTPLSNPPLTWSTTNPEVAAFATTTNTTGSNNASAKNNLGGATLFASCSPPSCNVGVSGFTPPGQTSAVPSLPVYATDYDASLGPKCKPPNLTKGFGTVSVDVTSTSIVPTYTAYVATTDCNNQVGCTSALFSVKPGLIPIGTTIYTLPRTPNSMMINYASRIYFGTDLGLMYLDIGSSTTTATLVSNSPTPCYVSLCGKVLNISNDGKLVVISDTVSTPSQVYIYNSGNSTTGPVDLVLSNTETAIAATFSPDQSKVFIATNLGNMYIYSTVDALTKVPIAPTATDIEFSSDGSFAYVAGTPASASVSAYSTCSLPGIGSAPLVPAVGTNGTPIKLFPSPVIPEPFDQGGLLWETQNVLALEPPYVESLQAQFRQRPIPYMPQMQFTCNPPSLLSFTAGQSYNLGQGNFTPFFARLVGDGTELIMVASHIPAVLIFNVNNGTTTSIPLVGNSNPLSADATSDGSQVYVAACDQYTQINPPPAPPTCTAGSVHIVNTITQGDYQQVPYVNIDDNNNPNMCNSQGGNGPLCLPNLVVIKPQ